MFELLEQNITKRIDISPSEWEIIKRYFTIRTFDKKEVLLATDVICAEIFFINQGCVRTYKTLNNAYEQVLQISFEDWWVSDIASFVHNIPSNVTIEAVEYSEVLVLTKENRDKIFLEVPAMERLFRFLAENAYAALQQRIFDYLAKSAEERYRDVLVQFPNISQRVPQRYIASYLGIQPQSLSRIRRRIIDNEKQENELEKTSDYL